MNSPGQDKAREQRAGRDIKRYKRSEQDGTAQDKTGRDEWREHRTGQEAGQDRISKRRELRMTSLT